MPFRPHRGVVVVVEEPATEDLSVWEAWLEADHHPALLATPGVAGVWQFASSGAWDLHPATQGEPQHTTVIYLDEDPVRTTEVLRPVIEDRWRSGAVSPRSRAFGQVHPSGIGPLA